MKKCLWLIFFATCMILARCGKNSFASVQIEEIEIYTAEANPENIWKIN